MSIETERDWNRSIADLSRRLVERDYEQSRTYSYLRNVCGRPVPLMSKQGGDCKSESSKWLRQAAEIAILTAIAAGVAFLWW
jgi:hypothetical protein